MQDELQAEVTPTGGIKPASSSGEIKGSTSSRNIKSGPGAGKKVLAVSVWADDPRDPDLVGEATVDLTEPLKVGEWDEWVALQYKGKFAGEVFLELTFYSAVRPTLSHFLG